MAAAIEMKALQHSKKGDVVSIGYRVPSREPISESIERLEGNQVLEVKTAFEVYARGKARYDYLSRKTEDEPNAHTTGGFAELECKQNMRPAEFTWQVYDLCEKLQPDYIWYHQPGLTPYGEYGISEARAVLDSKKSDALFGIWNREFVGVYYPSHGKILGAIEEITASEGRVHAGMGMNGMLQVDAYHSFKKNGNPDEKENWRLAKERMAARIIWHMRNHACETNNSEWMRIAGPLETPNGYHSIDGLGVLGKLDREIVFTHILSKLKGDDSLHLVQTKIPVGLYLNGGLTWVKHRPDAD
jgi:hypothetical protein